MSNNNNNNNNNNFQPYTLANKSLSLFKPFANKDYQKKLTVMENTYQSPLSEIKERVGSANRKLSQT